MRTKIKVNGSWVIGDPSIGEWYKQEVAQDIWQEQRKVADKTPEEISKAKAIRKISTGAMQRRFTIPEEVFITSDAASTVIKSRLLNASYADLDFQDTIEGVAYICSVLKIGGIIEDEAARVTELLQYGTQDGSI